MSELLKLAERLDAGKSDADTLRFSKCVVPGKKGYEWGAVMSSNPTVVQLLCDCWNHRKPIAAALRAIDSMKREG